MRSITPERALNAVIGSVQVPVEAQVNGRAAAFGLAGLTALAAALSTGSSLYYLLALMMGMMLAYALVSVIWTPVHPPGRGSSALGAWWSRAGNCAHRGGQAPVPVPVRSLELQLAVRETGRLPLGRSSPAPFRYVKYESAFRCPHRGAYQVGVTRLQATDLFGLITLARRAGGQMARVEVRPRVSGEEAMALQSVETGAEHISRMTEDTASPSGVRDWIPGDSLKKCTGSSRSQARAVGAHLRGVPRPDTLILVDLTPLSALRSHACPPRTPSARPPSRRLWRSSRRATRAHAAQRPVPPGGRRPDGGGGRALCGRADARSVRQPLFLRAGALHRNAGACPEPAARSWSRRRSPRASPTSPRSSSGRVCR